MSSKKKLVFNISLFLIVCFLWIPIAYSDETQHSINQSILMLLLDSEELNNCVDDVDCAEGAYCNSSGQCETKLSNGNNCSVNNECFSGFCTDGYCCDTACDSVCQSCAGSSTGVSDGTCSYIIAGTDPDDECMSSECDGTGQCY